MKSKEEGWKPFFALYVLLMEKEEIEEAKSGTRIEETATATSASAPLHFFGDAVVLLLPLLILLLLSASSPVALLDASWHSQYRCLPTPFFLRRLQLELPTHRNFHCHPSLSLSLFSFCS